MQWGGKLILQGWISTLFSLSSLQENRPRIPYLPIASVVVCKAMKDSNIIQLFQNLDKYLCLKIKNYENK